VVEGFLEAEEKAMIEFVMKYIRVAEQEEMSK